MMGVLRVSSAGANSGLSRSCCRRSGEAFRRNHLPGAGETPTWACVRALPLNTPARSRLQFVHPQFHCGNPPPAAEPRTFTRIYDLQFRVRVRAYFAVEFDNFVLRCGPFHGGCSQTQFTVSAYISSGQPNYSSPPSVRPTSFSRPKRAFAFASHPPRPPRPTAFHI